MPTQTSLRTLCRKMYKILIIRRSPTTTYIHSNRFPQIPQLDGRGQSFPYPTLPISYLVDAFNVLFNILGTFGASLRFMLLAFSHPTIGIIINPSIHPGSSMNVVGDAVVNYGL